MPKEEEEKTIKEYKKDFTIIPSDEVHVVHGQPAYKDAETLANRINKYFNEGCTFKERQVWVKDKDGHKIQQTISTPLPTITGLALFLGFSDRQSIYDYANNEERLGDRSCTMKRAITFIAREYEELLSGNNPTGAIFALKNFGWSDRLDINANIAQVDITGLRGQSQQARFGRVKNDPNTNTQAQLEAHEGG